MDQQEYLESEMIRCLVTTVWEDSEFREMGMQLGGCDISDRRAVICKN